MFSSNQLDDVNKWGICVIIKYFESLTDIKSRYDEEKSLREAADQRMGKLTEQLQKEKQDNERLQTELVQQHTHTKYLFSSH